MPRHLALILLLVPVLLTGCGTHRPSRQLSQLQCAAIFAETGSDGCFVLFDPLSGETSRYRSDRCAERLSPCSTFKIPNALIGLETGVISGPDHVLKWDGVLRERADTNRDHDLCSAIKFSVVWYFQELARRVGSERMQGFLDAIPYGNHDISAGIDQFWLGKSLAISADEQVRFIDRLRRRELPFSTRSMEIVRNCIVVRQSANATLLGKTGSDRGNNAPDLGWFVGWTEHPDRPGVVFAVNIKGRGMFGPQARIIAERVLESLGELPPSPVQDR